MGDLSLLEAVGVTIAALLALLGVVGGLLALPDQWKRFRTLRRPRGDRGTGNLVLSRDNLDTHTAVTFLVEGDLVHFLSSYVKPDMGGQIRTVEPCGEFYKVEIHYPPGHPLTFSIVKKHRDSPGSAT